MTGVRGKVVLGVGGDIARPGAATSSAGTGREEISTFCRESLSSGDREAMIDGGLAHYVRKLTNEIRFEIHKPKIFFELAAVLPSIPIKFGIVIGLGA